MQNKLAKFLFLITSALMLELVDPKSSYGYIRNRINGPECSRNTWCLPPSNYSLHASEYMFIVQARNMTWFEALEVCRKEGRGAELAAFDSFDELNWMDTATKHRGDWLLNAHYYLYADVPSWGSGLPICETVLPKVSIGRNERSIASLHQIHLGWTSNRVLQESRLQRVPRLVLLCDTLPVPRTTSCCATALRTCIPMRLANKSMAGDTTCSEDTQV